MLSVDATVLMNAGLIWYDFVSEVGGCFEIRTEVYVLCHLIFIVWLFDSRKSTYCGLNFAARLFMPHLWKITRIREIFSHSASGRLAQGAAQLWQRLFVKDQILGFPPSAAGAGWKRVLMVPEVCLKGLVKGAAEICWGSVCKSGCACCLSLCKCVCRQCRLDRNAGMLLSLRASSGEPAKGDS